MTFLAVFFISAGFLFSFVDVNSSLAADVDFNNIGSNPEDAKFTGYKGPSKHLNDDVTLESIAVENKDIKGAQQLGTGCGFSWATDPLDCLLSAILRIVGTLLNYAVDFFSWVADAERYSAVMENPSIYETWGLVRDLCNIGFILILLFSAFSTVFQYSKYSYKSILMWLVIMALLVNFSYPVTLFVIDLTNSLMYTILKVAFPNANAKEMLFTGENTGFTAIQDYINTANGDSNTTTMFFLIIFVFILALTILALGFILLIRLIALTIILIMSPIGFVGKIINKDGGWWDHLFKYAMAGPIIALVLLLCIKLMGAMTVSVSLDVGNNAISNAMISFTIPIVILWMGMAMAIKGIDGAGAIFGKAQGVAKAAGKKFSGFNFAKSQYGAYDSARKKRRAEIEKGRFMGTVGDKINKWQDTAIGVIPLVGGSARKRVDNMRKAEAAKDVREKAADLKGAKIEDLSVEVNSSFNAAGAIDPSKVNKATAGSAQAFMDKNADDRKTFIETTLVTAGGITGSSLQNLFASLPTTDRIIIAATAVAGGTATPDQLRQVTSYINRKSEEVVTHYTK